MDKITNYPAVLLSQVFNYLRGEKNGNVRSLDFWVDSYFPERLSRWFCFVSWQNKLLI